MAYVEWHGPAAIHAQTDAGLHSGQEFAVVLVRAWEVGGRALDAAERPAGKAAPEVTFFNVIHLAGNR